MTAPIRTSMNAGEFHRDHTDRITGRVRELAEQGWDAAQNGFEWPPVNQAFVHVWLYDPWRLLNDPETVAALAYTTVTGIDWGLARPDTKALWREAERVERARIARLPHWRATLAAAAA
ncbi:hypothetical protein [Prescottella equi]